MEDFLQYLANEKMAEEEIDRLEKAYEARIDRIEESYDPDPLSVEAVMLEKFPPKPAKKKWLGSIEGRECDLCDRALTFEKAFFDARTKSGRWGLLCPRCWMNHGIGLGTGRGQMYDSRTLEKIGED